MRAWVGLLILAGALAALATSVTAEPAEDAVRAPAGQAPAAAPEVPEARPPERVRDRLRSQLARERRFWARRGHRYRAEIRRLRHVVFTARPTPAGNRILAREMFGAAGYSCAATIITGETAGTWRHDVAYGRRFGEQLIYSGLAYGLGQARPGTKMLSRAAGGGPDAASNPWTQLRWMAAYARARYGSICAAAAHWTPARSW